MGHPMYALREGLERPWVVVGWCFEQRSGVSEMYLYGGQEEEKAGTDQPAMATSLSFAGHGTADFRRSSG